MKQDIKLGTVVEVDGEFVRVVRDVDIEESLERRVERLEALARVSGDLFLFVVESPDAHYLVVAGDVGDVMMMLPRQESIEFVGRANSLYKSNQILRVYPMGGLG